MQLSTLWILEHLSIWENLSIVLLWSLCFSLFKSYLLFQAFTTKNEGLHGWLSKPTSYLNDQDRPGLSHSSHMRVLSPPCLAISYWGFVAQSVNGAHSTIKFYVFNSPYKQRGSWYLHCIDLVYAFWKLILVRIMHIGLADVWTRFDMDTRVRSRGSTNVSWLSHWYLYRFYFSQKLIGGESSHQHPESFFLIPNTSNAFVLANMVCVSAVCQSDITLILFLVFSRTDIYLLY